MIPAARDFWDVLEAYSLDPFDRDVRNQLIVAGLRLKDDSAKTKWPALTDVGCEFARMLMSDETTGHRALLAGSIAAQIHATAMADLGRVPLPSTPPAPIRQYKDD